MSVSVGITSFFGRALLVVGCLVVIACAILVMNLAGPSEVGSSAGSSAGPEEDVSTSAKLPPEIPNPPEDRSPEPSDAPAAAQPSHIEPSVAEPVESPNRPSGAEPAITAPVGAVEIEDADLQYLKARDLLIPVSGISARDLRDSFHDSRSEGRTHFALDIRAPQGTPVLATADGKMKLHTSDKGGIGIYEFDTSGRYVYFYGHLQQYAEGVYEGKEIKRGEVIGYVGDTGNAGPGNYHLHFGVSKVAIPGKWSGGTPINPYPLLGGR